MSAEVPWLWFRTADRPLGALIQWDGEALVEQAIQAGKGLLLLTPHLGASSSPPRLCRALWPAPAHHRAVPPGPPGHAGRVADLFPHRAGHAGRAGQPVGRAADARALRKGETVGLLPDQVPPDGQGVWVPFFGRTAYTMTLAARLAQQTGARWC
jgi:KDO2-lipid IV(A) lauroyltransferase